MTQEFKHIVRIANTDIKGERSTLVGLRSIKGINFMFSHASLVLAKIPITRKIGELSEEEIKRIEEVILDPLNKGIPAWMVNRRFDPETGEDMHILNADLKFIQEQDKKMLRKVKSYKGLRHGAKLTVRGQRTKSNFRNKKGKGLGVKRKKK